MRFKNKYTFEERKKQVSDVLVKHPDRIPIICERHELTSKQCPEIDKKKSV